MFFAGLDLSRKRLDVHVVDVAGGTVLETAAPPGADGLRGLVERVEPLGPVRAAIESMNGARFVHDRLEQLGWEVAIADVQKVKGLVPLACKTHRIDVPPHSAARWRHGQGTNGSNFDGTRVSQAQNLALVRRPKPRRAG